MFVQAADEVNPPSPHCHKLAAMACACDAISAQGTGGIEPCWALLQAFQQAAISSLALTAAAAQALIWDARSKLLQNLLRTVTQQATRMLQEQQKQEQQQQQSDHRSRAFTASAALAELRDLSQMPLGTAPKVAAFKTTVEACRQNDTGSMLLWALEHAVMAVSGHPLLSMPLQQALCFWHAALAAPAAADDPMLVLGPMRSEAVRAVTTGLNVHGQVSLGTVRGCTW